MVMLWSLRRWLVVDLVMRWGWSRGLWRQLVVDLVVPLLVEDIQVVLHLCEPRLLPVDVLLASFGALHYSLPSQDGFLFLSEPPNLLLDSGEFLFLCFCFSLTSSSQSSIWM
jgi:hypothetical protein